MAGTLTAVCAGVDVDVSSTDVSDVASLVVLKSGQKIDLLHKGRYLWEGKKARTDVLADRIVMIVTNKTALEKFHWRCAVVVVDGRAVPL